MKTEINKETLICQIVEAEQMLIGINDRNIHILLSEIELLRSETKGMGDSTKEEKYINQMIDKLERETRNAQTKINLQHDEIIREDQRKEDDATTI